MWLDNVKNTYRGDLTITWKNFQLEQANNKEAEEWNVWDLPDHHDARSLVAAMAAEAARLQGDEEFDRFHLALLTERHGSKTRIPLNKDESVVLVAKKVGLDLKKFETDLKDRSLLEKIAKDHSEGTEDHGVFGTPTFVFEGGNAGYLKTFIPPVEDSASFFEHFVALTFHRPYIGELKRPQPPWPKGLS